MNIEEFRDYCLSKKGVGESFPFDNKTLVFKVMDKMFALCGIENLPLRVNLKCEPDNAIRLRDAYPDAILPGYHMNKRHWNTVIINRIPPHLTLKMIDESYDLIVQKFPKKTKEAYQALN